MRKHFLTWLIAFALVTAANAAVPLFDILPLPVTPAELAVLPCGSTFTLNEFEWRVDYAAGIMYNCYDNSVLQDGTGYEWYAIGIDGDVSAGNPFTTNSLAVVLNNIPPVLQAFQALSFNSATSALTVGLSGQGAIGIGKAPIASLDIAATFGSQIKMKGGGFQSDYITIVDSLEAPIFSVSTNGFMTTAGGGLFGGDLNVNGDILVPTSNDPVTPSYGFASGSGFYESSAGSIRVSITGAPKWNWQSTFFAALASGSPRMKNLTSTSTTPVWVHNHFSDNTGRGGEPGEISDIISGVEIWNIDTNGDATLNGDLSVTGDVTVTGKLTKTGSTFHGYFTSANEPTGVQGDSYYNLDPDKDTMFLRNVTGFQSIAQPPSGASGAGVQPVANFAALPGCGPSTNKWQVFSTDDNGKWYRCAESTLGAADWAFLQIPYIGGKVALTEGIVPYSKLGVLTDTPMSFNGASEIDITGTLDVSSTVFAGGISPDAVVVGGSGGRLTSDVNLLAFEVSTGRLSLGDPTPPAMLTIEAPNGDKLASWEGEAGNSSRFSVDSLGSVAIGDDGVSDLNGDDSRLYVRSDNGEPSLIIVDTREPGDLAGACFSKDDDNQWCILSPNEHPSALVNNELVFENASGNPVFALRQNTNAEFFGPAGIGTATPQKLLEVKGGDNQGIRVSADISSNNRIELIPSNAEHSVITVATGRTDRDAGFGVSNFPASGNYRWGLNNLDFYLQPGLIANGSMASSSIGLKMVPSGDLTQRGNFTVESGKSCITTPDGTSCNHGGHITAPANCVAPFDYYIDSSGGRCVCLTTDTWTNTGTIGNCL